MAETFEIQVRTKDPDDGAIIGIQTAGDVITPAEFKDWMDNANLPNGPLSRIPRYCSRPWIKRLYELKYLQDKSVDELVTNYHHNWIGIIPANVTAEERQKALIKCAKMVTKLKAANLADVTNGRTEGFDTKWGRGDLSSFLILCVDGVTTDDINQYKFKDFDVSDFAVDRLPGGEKGRAYKIDWRSLMSASTISNVEDKDIIVPVKRTKIHLKSVIIKITGREF